MAGKLVIFDLDGTILDTLEDLHDSLNEILRRHGMEERTLGETRSFVGNGIRKLICRAVAEGTGEETIDIMFSEFLPYYKEHCKEKTVPYRGIPELLKKLRGERYQTAVVSNKADSAVQELCTHYFPGLFDACAGEKPDIRRKPSPDAVNLLLSELSVQKEKAVYIGDSDVDVETARNAGLSFIGVDWGFRGKEFLASHGADRIAMNPEELFDQIHERLP